MKVRDLVLQALLEIAVLDPVDPLEQEDLATAQLTLQRMADTQQADRHSLFTEQVVPFALVPNAQTTSLGVGGTFDLTAAFGAGAPRPTFIGRCSVTPAGDVLEYPLVPYARRRDYQAEPLKSLTDLFPRRFLYEPSWPLGLLSWWPIPTTAATVNLALPLPLTVPLAPDTVLSFPPGYQELWVYELAKRLCVPYRKKATPELLDALREARALVRRNNDEGPPPARCDGVAAGGYDIYSNRNRLG